MCPNELKLFAEWKKYTGIKFQSWARDNTVATTRPCFQATKLFVIAILLYLVWLLHLDTGT